MTCAGCSKDTPQASKWCSEACRKRSFRANGGIADPRPVAVVGARAGGCETATSNALREANRVETPLGQAALALAARIDLQADTGSSMAALAKQLEATLAAATAGAQTVTRLDELRARRDRKRRA